MSTDQAPLNASMETESGPWQMLSAMLPTADWTAEIVR